VDILVHVVVLNLFVEYFPRVISETFTLSFLTAGASAHQGSRPGLLGSPGGGH
jgi:hypothetical protein